MKTYRHTTKTYLRVVAATDVALGMLLADRQAWVG